MVETILSIIAGLSLFLFAVSNLSETLKALLGDQAKKWVAIFTRNTLMGVLTGTILTIILDSSSAVIILTIVLVNAKTLRFENSLGIILGANIGTTFSSQLIALDIGKYSPVPIFIGFLLSVISKSKSVSSVGKTLLYFGIMFFGLYTMERSVEPLREQKDFVEWMTRLDNPWKGAGIGAVVTLVLQSSSATVGMVITLAKKELISLAAGIAVMLGAELGTCSDTLLATIGGSRQALRAGIFHLVFNFISITIGLFTFPWFVALIEKISSGASIQQKVANAHMLFNIGGVILFLPFVPLVARLLTRLVADRDADKHHTKMKATTAAELNN